MEGVVEGGSNQTFVSACEILLAICSSFITTYEIKLSIDKVIEFFFTVKRFIKSHDKNLFYNE